MLIICNLAGNGLVGQLHLGQDQAFSALGPIL